MDSGQQMSSEKTWERRLNVAKAKHRPTLRNWKVDEFASKRHDDFMGTHTIDDSKPYNTTKLKISRVNVKGCSASNFVKYFEKDYKPCMISGIPSEEGWKATESWTCDKIRDKYKHRMFRVGEDDDGVSAKAKMKHFVDYQKHNTDDSPLKIFDSNYDRDAVGKSILEDYKVPAYFSDDLFSLVGEKRRPPYRWFLMGPERSGTCVHLDPLATSAWNTVITGRKRWVLFPPGTPRSIADGSDVLRKGEDDEAINYFVDLLPRIKEQYGSEMQIMECIQEPGETIYVPGGWWHGVLNLTDTIAITQNFCSYSNFDAVWRATRKRRRKMSVTWLRELSVDHPSLAKRALQLNLEDGFEMPVSSKSEVLTENIATVIETDSLESDKKEAKRDKKSEKKKRKLEGGGDDNMLKVSKKANVVHDDSSDN